MATSKKNKIKIIIFFLTLVAIGVAGVVWYRGYTSQIVAVGVLRTSGLNEEEKKKLGLKSSQFQITDFDLSKMDAYSPELIHGYYLESSNIPEKLLGKCVRVVGNIKPGWEKTMEKSFIFNQQWSYQRIALIPNQIKEINYESCKPYAETSIDDKQTLSNLEKTPLHGIVQHITRPAPDIYYDYDLQLNKPFMLKENATGQPQAVNKIDIIPGNNSIWTEIEKNINKEVSLEGYLKWGYSESRHLEVTKVTRNLKPS